MLPKKRFYCLRCQNRFDAEYEAKLVVERSCPACGSNSVRLETPAAAAAHEKMHRR
jgi:Zn finger protein HypA/HybF involved in hydrogenase expression